MYKKLGGKVERARDQLFTYSRVRRGGVGVVVVVLRLRDSYDKCPRRRMMMMSRRGHVLSAARPLISTAQRRLISTATRKLLADTGATIPIIKGPMYPGSNPELVAAVSEAGGFGVVREPNGLRILAPSPPCQASASAQACRL